MNDSSLLPSSDVEWEYLYISRESWRQRVVARCGYGWKLLWTADARRQHIQLSESAIQTELNEFGGAGWELVGWVPVTLALLGSIGSEMIFKRRKR